MPRWPVMKVFGMGEMRKGRTRAGDDFFKLEFDQLRIDRDAEHLAGKQIGYRAAGTCVLGEIGKALLAVLGTG